MPHKRYRVADDTYARLQTGISATTTTINIIPPTESWARNFTGNNTIATLVQYGVDGNPTKKEKVYISAMAGNVLTVMRGYL